MVLLLIIPDGVDDDLGNHSVETYTDIKQLKEDHPNIYNMLVGAGLINE